MVRKLSFVLVCQVVLSLAVGACSSAESTSAPGGTDFAMPDGIAPGSLGPTDEIGPPSDAVSQLIRYALRSERTVSYSTLVQRLGKPERVRTQPIQNQYVRGQTDTLRTLVYTGIEALVYDVANESKTFLVRLSLLSTRYMTPDGLRVGLGTDQVIEKVGPPSRRNPGRGELIYQETEATPTAMVLQVREGRVVRIDWEFYFA